MTTYILILWGACIAAAFALYAVNVNEAKFKKNIAVGVTFPMAGRGDPEVQGLLKGFRREQLVICLAAAALGVLCAALAWPGVSYCLLFLWVDLLIVAEFVSTARWNGRLKAVKKARGWTVPSLRTASVSVPAAPARRISPWWFIAAAVVAAVPAALDREMWYIYLLDGAMALACWPASRYLYRNRAETVDENDAVTEALTRVRRRTWDRVWIMSAWLLAAVNACLFLSKEVFPDGSALFWAITALSAGMCAAAVWLELRVRRVQEKLTADSGQGFYVDEDDKWLWGQLYYDPNDRRTVINARTGVNSTVNLARPGGKVLAVFALALLFVVLPGMGVCFDAMGDAPLPLKVEDGALVAESWGRDYSLPLEEIADAALLDKLPVITARLWGVGMDSILKGRFQTQWGRATLCLDPRTGPWLKVTMADGGLYILGGGDGSGTETAWAALERR